MCLSKLSERLMTALHPGTVHESAMKVPWLRVVRMWRLKFDERSRREPVNCAGQREQCVTLVSEDGDGVGKDDSGVAVGLGWVLGEDSLVKVEDAIVDGEASMSVCLSVEDVSRLDSANVCLVSNFWSTSLLRPWRGTICSSRWRLSISTTEIKTMSKCVA